MAGPHARPIFAVCVGNEGSDDLSLGLLYRHLPDDAAACEDHLRVIDDSGEDYLDPAGRFVIVSVPQGDEPRLLAIASSNVA